MLSKRLFYFGFTAVLTTTMCSLLLAAKVKHMNLLALVQHAEQIFAGEVVAVDEDFVSAGGGRIPCTVYTVQIYDRIRGSATQQVRFRFAGAKTMHVNGKYGYRFDIPGMPHYKRGDQILLFLNRASEVQLTAPMGLFQGSFRVYYDSRTGRKMVINGSQNAGLFKGLSEAKLQGVKLNAAEANLLQTAKGPLEYDAFVSLVRKLAQ